MSLTEEFLTVLPLTGFFFFFFPSGIWLTAICWTGLPPTGFFFLLSGTWLTAMFSAPSVQDNTGLKSVDTRTYG